MFGLTYDLAPFGAPSEIALVMLPGAGMHPQDFKNNGFVEAIRNRGLPVDVVILEAEVDAYMPTEFAKRMRSEVVKPLRASGYRSIWLAGISLGAYGAMRLLQERADDIEGMLLLAPFLSTRGMIAQILRGGGLDQWSPAPGERESIDESLLCWLKDNLTTGKLPHIYLGWGEEDRYADASKLLAAHLPHDRIFHICGDHNWTTWGTLWHEMLNAVPFAPLPTPAGTLQ